MKEIEEDSFGHWEVVPPEPVPVPIAYRNDNRLFVEKDAEIPLESCICCGKRASRTVTRSLRNPKKPATWFGKARQLEVGLCRRHSDDHLIGIALTWSLLSVGLLVLFTGAVTLSISIALVGVFAMILSGVFRAAMPVSAEDPKAEVLEIRGAAAAYLRQMKEQ